MAASDGRWLHTVSDRAMSEQKPTAPRGRMGVYKRLEEVPAEHRLRSYRDRYEGLDVLETFLTEYLFDRYSSDRFVEDTRRAARRWKEHMSARGRHHALATPRDVEAWCSDLVDRYVPKTSYNSYWVRIERFYRWLRWHTDHPHLYDPVLMAAAEYPAAGSIWDEKISRGRNSSEGDT